METFRILLEESSHKILRDRAFNINNNPKYVGIKDILL